MIIWSGAGFLVAVIAFLTLLLAEVSVEKIFHDDSYYQSHGWPKLLAFCIAGCLVLPLGRYLNRKGARTLIEKDTGREIVQKANHSLFFINVKYWPYILFALGMVFLFVDL